MKTPTIEELQATVRIYRIFHFVLLATILGLSATTLYTMMLNAESFAKCIG